MVAVKVYLTWIFYGLHGGVSLPNVEKLFEKMMQGNTCKKVVKHLKIVLNDITLYYVHNCINKK